MAEVMCVDYDRPGSAFRAERVLVRGRPGRGGAVLTAVADLPGTPHPDAKAVEAALRAEFAAGRCYGPGDPMPNLFARG